MQWETGDASGGESGLGGDCAVAGFSNGTGNPGTYYQLAGSAACGELIDGGVNALSNSQVVFQVRNGEVEIPVGVPEPLAIAIFGAGLVGFGFARRRSR